MEKKYMTIGKCPVCGADLKDYTRAYGCSNWKHKEDGSGDCQFTVWKDTFGKLVSLEELDKLLNGEELGIYTFFTKEGEAFESSMILDTENNGIKLIDEREG